MWMQKTWVCVCGLCEELKKQNAKVSYKKIVTRCSCCGGDETNTEVEKKVGVERFILKNMIASILYKIKKKQSDDGGCCWSQVGCGWLFSKN